MMRFCLSILIICVAVSLFSGCRCGPSGMYGGKVGLVEIKGTIIEPDEVIEDLEKARKTKSVKSVVVRVDSPGGSVGASQEIFHAIKKLDEEKPVIVSMGDIAASGGYYVSAGARKIYANDGTITGSLGVRMELLNAKGLFELMRLKPETLKSGKYKDIGSVYRSLKPEERKILEDLLAELHIQFKNDVAEARELKIETVDKIADGRVFTGLKAKDLGLIDEMGGLIVAVKDAATIAGLKGEPRIMKMRKEKPWWYGFVAEKVSALLGQVSGNFNSHKYFLYEWKP